MSRPFKSKKQNLYTLLILIFFSGTTFVLINLFISNKKILISSLYEELMIYNFGFSSLGNLVDKEGTGSEFVSKREKLNKLITHFFKYPFIKKPNDEEKIPLLEINIPYEDLSIIYKDRITAINKGFSKNQNWVNGEIKIGEKKVDAKIRLKGLLGAHWEADKRFSLKFKVKKDKSNNQLNTILGMTSFSLHKLRARQYPYEYIFQEIIPEIGLKSVKHQIVKVKLNGINWGYMDMQESFNTVMLEKNQLKDSLILSFNDEIYQFDYEKTSRDPLSRDKYWLSNPRLYIDLSGKSRKNLTKQEKDKLTYILNSLQEDEYQSILFSASHLTAANEVLKIWGNFHAISVGNARYYFNPYTLKLEPLMADQGPFKSSDKDNDLFKIQNGGLLDLSLIGKYPEISDKVMGLLEQKTPYKLSENLFPQDLKLNTNIPKSNYLLEKKFDLQKKRNSSQNAQIQDLYGDEIICNNDRYKLKTDFDAIKANFDNNNIYIHNLLCGKLTINEINICNQTFKNKFVIDKNKIVLNKPFIIDRSLLLKSDESLFSSDIKKSNNCSGDNYVRYSFNQQDKLSKIDLLNNIGIKENPLLKENINRDFIKVSSKGFTIDKGIYEVEKPLFIEGDLIINQGTTLKFNNNSYLIVKGNVNIKGTKENSVLMTSINKENTWKGFYVFNEEIYKNDESKINYLKIENTTELDEGILDLTGGVNFYNLNLVINNLNIENSTAEDGLNIINSKIRINNLEINNTKSDAFDCDFCIGNIDNLSFTNVGGDGLDLSGSIISAKILGAAYIKDKVVSVGEKSNLKLDLRNVSNSYVAVAVKDASNADIEIREINTLGPKVMSYNKKPFYEGKTRVDIKYTPKKSLDKRNFVAAIDTEMNLNNKKLDEVFINVKKMYKEGPMKK